MGIIQTAYLTHMRQAARSIPRLARYKIGSAWTTAEIAEAEVLENGSVAISFYVRRASAENVPATRFRLFDEGGSLLADKEETVSFTDETPEVLYRFRFTVEAAEGAEPVEEP